MSNFIAFKTAIQKQFEKMSEHDLFVTGIEKDALWETYLGSFPEGTNNIFRERREYDCQCCRQFIRACGNMVAIIDNKLVSIWDTEVEGYYQTVTDAMAGLVKSEKVRDAYFSNEKKLGTNFNRQLVEGSDSIKWQHFYLEIPGKFVKKDIGPILSDKRSGKDVFKRALDEITIESAETVLELIEQNSIYRGEENKSVVELFIKHKKEYMAIPHEESDNFCWSRSMLIGSAARIRSTAIGTLLVDISDGKGLDVAVKLFESKVAPTNYKRPTALISKSMIKNAEKKVAELGIENSLSRRFAVTEDITINNVIFADREAKKVMNVFDEMAAETPSNTKNLEKVDGVDIETFVSDILPKADSVELMFENKHTNNLVSLIAPQDNDSKNILKWDNNFSWAYSGEVADSIKERVKKAGGNVEGVLRCSLSWFNYDDLDIHVIEPGGRRIYFSDKSNPVTGGSLDVDMNAGGRSTRNGVENITWPDKSRMQEGRYTVIINQFALREMKDFGFDAEIEYDGVIHEFHYSEKMRDKENVTVAEFTFSRKDGIKIVSSLPSTKASKEVWGVQTNQFRKVSMVMNSPNHWNGNKTGNKHYFFMLEDCKNDSKARGFFNEFLSEDLREHRKVFEVLGSKMKVEKAEEQLSGLGFSSSMRNSIILKVSGAFSRILKVNF